MPSVNRSRRCLSAVALILLSTGIALAIAACGGGSNGGSTSSSSSGLWVPNFDGESVAAFSAKTSRQSGNPTANILLSNAEILHPQETLFDKKGNLWVTNCVDPLVGAGSIAKYTAHQVSQLSKDPGQDPDLVLGDDGSFSTFACPYGEVFDTKGNLWVTNRFGGDVIQFTAAQIAVGGITEPNTTIFSNSFENLEGLQFDAAGTLWIADIVESRIFGYKAATLAAAEGFSGAVDPDIVNSSTAVSGPADVLIDKSGNQWIANCFNNTLVEFAAADTTASGSPTPIVVLTATTVTTATGSALSFDCPQGLALDKKGNLWVSNAASDNAGSIAEFSKDDITVNGNPTPVVFLDSDVNGTYLNDPVLFTFGPNVR